MTPTPTQTSEQQTIAFWQSVGEHAALVAITLGEQIGLAFLTGFLTKKLGTPINIQLPPAV